MSYWFCIYLYPFLFISIRCSINICAVRDLCIFKCKNSITLFLYNIYYALKPMPFLFHNLFVTVQLAYFLSSLLSSSQVLSRKIIKFWKNVQYLIEFTNDAIIYSNILYENVSVKIFVVAFDLLIFISITLFRKGWGNSFTPQFIIFY